jgi:uncharacterized protein
MKKEIIENVGYRKITYDSCKPGLTFCVVGGVHGNETCGVNLVDKLESWFSNGKELLTGKLWTLVANTQAVKLRKRFVHSDLNRAFINTSYIGYEFQLAQQLTKELIGIDYLLDLHSTSAPVQPFCTGILTPKHYNLFVSTGLEIYMHGWETHRGYSMLIDEVNRLGGVGVIAECGKTNTLQSNQVAYQVTMRILKSLMMISFSDLVISQKERIVLRIKEIVKAKTSSFSFARNFRNLEEIKSGEAIAFDGSKAVTYPSPFIITMPNYGNIEAGDEVFGVGIIEEYI